MVDYVDTRIGFKPHDRGSENEYIYVQAKIELERLELARKKRIAASKNSFVDWMQCEIAMIGRACGYHLKTIPRIKIIRLWKWLFDDRLN